MYLSNVTTGTLWDIASKNSFDWTALPRKTKYLQVDSYNSTKKSIRFGIHRLSSEIQSRDEQKPNSKTNQNATRSHISAINKFDDFLTEFD